MFGNKKIMLRFMALFFTISLSLAGCGKNADTSVTEANSTDGGNTEVETTASLPEVEISIYFPGGDSTGDEGLVYEKVNKITKEKINATINFQSLSSGYQDKLSVMMAASEEFDICFTSSWCLNYLSAVAKGYYVPLDDLLKNYAPKLYSSMSEDIWNAVRVKGSIYAVPNQQIFARSSLLSIPEEYAKKYGFDVKAINFNSFKIEDLEPYLEKFKNGEKDKYPFRMNNWTNNDWSGYYKLDLLGGGNVPGAILINDSSLKVFNQFESDQYKNYITLMKSWNDKGYLRSKDFLVNREQLSTSKDSGKMTGAYVGSTWAPGVDAIMTKEWNTPMVCAAMSESTLYTSGITGTLDAISRTSNNPESAMMFLELLNSDVELYNLITWGIEGKHYIKKEGNYIEPIPDIKYAAVPNWLIATQFNSLLTEGQPEDIWEQTKKLNKEAKASPALGFSFDPTPVKTEISNCSAIIQEYDQGLSYGLLDLNVDYPTFVDKLKKAGSDKIVEEMQKQLDAWKNTK